MADENERLQDAQELVKSGQHQQAREILETMPDHPTAQKWLAQLNERFPPDTDAAQADVSQQAEHIESESKGATTMSDNPTPTPEETPQTDQPTPQPQKEQAAPQPPRPQATRAATDYTVPMPPQIADVVKEQIIDRLGKVGGVVAIGAILYGIGSAIEYSYFGGGNVNTFLYAIIATAVTALFTYGLSFALSLSFPTIPRNTFFIFVGFTTGLTFFLMLIDSRLSFTFANSSLVLAWLTRAIFGIGVAYAFANMNRFVPSQGEPRLNRNMFILTAIAMTLFTSAGSGIINAFRFSSGLDLGDFIGALLGGLIAGALFSAILVIALQESADKSKSDS
ncbi:MAG: hypothetical protein EA396_09775 [Anaerolineaceae bacterium]|nr:MAG: hypothetical protein EA396_09775 [Anaerolineaceae bacterium]